MKNIISTLLSGLVILMAGCSSEIPGNSESQTTSGGSILRLDINKADMTRAGLESTSFDEGDEVFVVVTDRTNPDILTVTTKATYTGSKWMLADEINFTTEVSGVMWGTVDLQVYYPYEVALARYDKETGKINLPSFGTSQDFLYGASYGWSKSNPVAKVTCKHAMTRLTLALNNQSGEDVEIKGTKIENEGVQSFLGISGTLDKDGISVTEYGDVIPVPGVLNIPSGSTSHYDILLPPTLYAYDRMQELIGAEGVSRTVLKFQIELSDRTVNFDIEANVWREGCQYTYPVTIQEPEKPEYSGIIDGHEYVDLGLSVKWATCNVGASNAALPGDYFAWGEIIPKDNYNTGNCLTYNKEIDDISGNPEYDAATYHWGGSWRMPTKPEWEELVSKCEWTWIKWWEGEMGYEIVGPSGESIFLPAAGDISGTTLYDYTTCGNYWTSSAYNVGMDNAYILFFNNGSHYAIYGNRSLGRSVRPVAE